MKFQTIKGAAYHFMLCYGWINMRVCCHKFNSLRKEHIWESFNELLVTANNENVKKMNCLANGKHIFNRDSVFILMFICLGISNIANTQRALTHDQNLHTLPECMEVKDINRLYNTR